jgi:hypothetical protein
MSQLPRPLPEARWLDPLALGLVAAALLVAAHGLLLVPQRLAQRPAVAAVLALRLEAGGGLRLWHQPIAPAELPALLRRAAGRGPGVRLRLQPDPGVPWGMVQGLIERLEGSDLILELQLP